MREDLSGLSQQPAAPKPKKPGEPIDLVALAEDLKGAHPAAAPPLPSSPSRGVGAAPRFPDNQPRFDRFGEPVNEAARDVETAKGGGFAPLGAKTFRTQLLGEALGAGRTALAVPGFIEQGFELPGSPFAAPFLAGRALRGLVTGEPLVPNAAPERSFAAGMNPLPTVERAMRGDPEAVGSLLALPVLGKAMAPETGASLARTATVVPEAAEAFRTLGLDPRRATEAEVQAAWRETAQRTHPDVAPADRTARGGPADPIVAAQEFNRATQARETALSALGRDRPAQGFQQPGAEETQFRAQQTKRQPAPAAPPGAPAPVPPVAAAASAAPDALRDLSDEQLAAQSALGSTPPLAQSGAAPGAQEARVSQAAGRMLDRERRQTAQPVPVERRGVSAPPQAVAGPGEPIHPALHEDARIAFEAASDDPLKAQKESLAARIAGDGPTFAPIARMRQAGATDQEIAAHIAAQGVRNAPQWVDMARTMFRIPEPGGQPTAEMPVSRETGAVEAGAPHDQAAVQEGLFGEKALAGKEQAELMPETAGVPVNKLKAGKIQPEEVSRVKREGAEPAGERPAALEGFIGTGPESMAPEDLAKTTVIGKAGKPPKQTGTEKLLARHAELTAQIARDEQIAGAGTSQSTFTDVGGHIGQPGQKFVRTFAKGPAYAARGRLAQAKQRLADLERTMAPEELAQARAAAEPVAAAKAEETSEAAAQGGKTSAQVEREGIEREGEREKPDYEALAAKQQGPIPPAMKDLIHQRLIEYGDTKAELENLLPLELANRALEREVLSPSEETRLLDAVWPDMGALLRARRKGAPIPEVTAPQRSVRDEFRKQLYPEKRGPEAAVAGRLLRRAIGEFRRDKAIYRQMLKDARHQVPSLKTPEGIEFYDRAENGVGQVKPELQGAVDIIRKIYDGIVRDIQALGTGRLAMPIENYMAHGWKDPTKAKQVYGEIAQSQARRPLAGSKAFLKERTIPRLVDGLRKNLEPITDNPVDLNLWKMDQMRKYLFAQRFMQDAKGEGIARFFRVGENLPDGWGRVEDPTFAVYGRTEAGELVLRGHWGMPTIARDLVMNYLSPGLRGNPIADAWLGAANSMVAFKLGASGFHAGFSTYTGAISRVALGIGKLRTMRQPFAEPTKGGLVGGAAGAALGGAVAGVPGAALGATLLSTAGRLLQKGLALKAVYLDPAAGTVLEQQIAALMARGGAQHEMPAEYRTATVAALQEAARRGNLPKVLAHTVGLALQTIAWPTMQFYVPLIKMGAFADIMQGEVARMGPLATDAALDKAAQDAWHTIDNRFGQVSYDTRFWNNTLKHVMMGTIQAVGWDVGTVDEHLGGLKDALAGKPSPRFDFFLALPLTIALLSVMIQYALTGEGPSSIQDLFEPRNGKVDEFGNPERVTPASYMKDIIGLTRHPVQTVQNKLNPLIGFLGRLLANRDFYGNKWRNEQDPVAEQLKQSWKFVRDEWTPISVKNIEEERRRGITGPRAALPMVGITPASREAVRTKAQNMMIQMLRERTPARTPEEQAVAAGKREERQGLSPEQRLVGMFRKLSPDQRHQVYGVADERERELFGPYVERRMKAYKQ